MSKFIKQYPALWVPKVGDRIKIIKLMDGFRNIVGTWDYHINQIGTIIHVSSRNSDLYIIEFDSNRKNEVFREEFELVDYD